VYPIKKAPYQKRRKRKDGPLKWHIIAAESTNRKFFEQTASPKNAPPHAVVRKNVKNNL
jgi:hypothetical protein